MYINALFLRMMERINTWTEEGGVNTFVLFDSANRRYYNTVDAAQVLTIGTDGTAVIMGGQETRLILMQRLTYQRFDFYF